MTTYHDEVELEDFEYDESDGVYYYPCPCGDQFEISRAELLAGEEEATCPSCSLVVRVVYDKDAYRAKYAEDEVEVAEDQDEEVEVKEQKELEDFEYDEEAEEYSYPCNCGQRILASRKALLAGRPEARCSKCPRAIKIVYETDALSARFDEVLSVRDKQTVKQT